MPRRLHGPEDEEFADYENYLNGFVWPGAETRGASSGGHTYVGTLLGAEGPEMPQAYAANALAKLVRWARHAPVGDTALRHDEDAREEFVRVSTLGVALAARACGLEPEHFHALYGEVGPGEDAHPHYLLGELVVALGDALEGLGHRLSVPQRAQVAGALLEALMARYRVTERLS